jgi:integrase
VKKSAENHWAGNPYRRPNSPFWSFVYRDAAGVVRRRSAKTKDLRIAREALAKQLREVELQKAGHVDRYAPTRKAPLADVLKAFQEHLIAERRTPGYAKTTVRMLRDFATFAGIGTVGAIAFGDATRFADAMRAKHSPKTRDNYAGALRSFGSWLRNTGRWDCDPFDGLATRTAKKDRDRTFKRVSFRFEEVERLVAAAWARFEAEKAHGGTPMHRGNDGDSVRDRQVLYWFAVTTGFRVRECASTRWEDLTLDGPKLAVRLGGQFCKNGNDANIPLQAFVAEALREMRKRRSAAQMRREDGPVLETDAVFEVGTQVARIVRKDAAFAGLIPQRSPTTKRVDFHCLRKSCARILIEMGVHPKFIQQVLRHSDVRLTMDLYGELDENDLFRELPGKVPVPRAFAGSAPAAIAQSEPRVG